MWDNSAFNHNQTFLSGGGLQTETECGLLSPLHATCPHSSGHRSRSSLMPLAIWVLHPRCVIWSPSTAQLAHPLCIHACKCVCILCNPIILQSVLPPTGWARYWHWDTTVSTNCILSWEKITMQVILHFAFSFSFFLELTTSWNFRCPRTL